MIAVLLLAALFAYVGSPLHVVTALSSSQYFFTERAALEHCPSDVVVWLNTRSGVYHFKGHEWYGATKFGAYACRTEIGSGGNRPSRSRS